MRRAVGSESISLTKVYAPVKLVIREMLRRSGSIYINRDGFLTMRWRWLRKLYSWTYKP
jgi:hypothetical protein